MASIDVAWRFGIIMIAGRVAVGKTSIARALGQCLNVPVISMSHVLRVCAADLGESTRAQVQDYGWDLVRANPEKLVHLTLTEALAAKDGRPAVVDGPRSIELVRLLRLRTSPAKSAMLYVRAPFDVRAARAKAREGLSAEQLATVDDHPVERGQLSLIDDADLVLDGQLATQQNVRTCIEFLGLLAPGDKAVRR